MRITIKSGIQPGEYAELVRAGDFWEVRKDGQCIQKLKDSALFQPLGLPRYRLLGLENNEARVIRFADLHRHSDNSLLDGMTQVPEMVERTEYAGALTDHGNMYGFLEYYKLMKAAGKKPILGFEGYMESLDGQLEGRHVILLAKNERGVKNLFKLVSEAYDNFKRKPHVTWAMMRQYHEDVMCLSACLGGVIPTCLKRGRYDDARQAVEKFISIFGKEDFYLEIQRHGIAEEVSVNAGLERLAQEYGLKLVATTDSHYPTKDDAYPHEVLLCLQTDKTIDDPKRLRYDGSGYHLQTSEEMEELFRDKPEVLDNTLELADKVNIELKLGDVNLPNYDIPKRYATPMDYLTHLAKKGYQDRFSGTPHEKDPVYQQRFEYEINMIKQMGFASYFIIVWDFINYARKNNIYVGPGRGSAAGSIVAYCLGITDLDPIKYNLLFERFLNPERVSWPDIDTDIEFSRRPEVIAYMTKKYGAENVCRIVTFGTLAAKQVVKDVARCLGMPAYYGAKLSDAIPKTPKITIQKALDLGQEFKQLYDSDSKAKEIIDIAIRLEGNKRHASQHACFTADTLITTKQGMKKIVDVEAGDEVLTHMGRYMPVVSTIETETDELFKVSVYRNCPFTATGNHPVLVRHRTFVSARSSNGNRTSKRVYSAPEWMEVRSLQKGDYIGLPINQSAVTPDIPGLPAHLEAFWWILGRYVGDGWTEEYKRPEISENHIERRIIICCGKENTRKSVSDIESKLRECGFDYRVENSRTAYKVFIKGNMALYGYLQSFGRYAHGKRLNGDVINLPVSLAKAFLTGYMSADGRYEPSTDEYSCRTVSRELAMGLSILINKIHHVGAGYSQKQAADETIEGRPVHSKEKYTLYYKLDERPGSMSFYEDGYVWVAVKNIEVLQGHQKTYNLTVLNDSSYQANGIAAHNCGLVCAPRVVSDFLPTSMEYDDETKEKGLTSQVTMSEVEELSLIKMDLLGLKNMGVIHEVIDRIQETRGKENILRQIGSTRSEVRYQDIPLNDRKVYQMLASGNTGGVFQLESPGMTNVIRQMYYDIDDLPEDRLDECFERLIATVALYRPGPMDFIPNYIAGMRDVHNIQYLTPELESILRPTYGTIVYQEEVMQIVQKLAGYTLGRADLVRKGMAKKKAKVLAAEKKVFIYGNKEEYESGQDSSYAPGCIANGIPEAVAQEIWHQMDSFGSYAFNRSHAACYAFLAYITAYMKCYWPQEFYAAMLNAFVENSDKVKIYLSQATKLGLKMFSPDINLSACCFLSEKDGIRFGLEGISGLKAMATAITDERALNGPYRDFQDLYERMDTFGQKLNKKCVEGLVYAGALNSFTPNKAALFALFAQLETRSKNKSLNEAKALNQISFFDESVSRMPLPDVPMMDERAALEKEREVLGLYLSKHPTDIILAHVKNKGSYCALELIPEKVEKEGRIGLDTVGLVKNLRRFYTKSGKEMMSFTLENRFASFDAVVFSDDMDACAPSIHENDVISVRGTASVNERSQSVQIVVKGVVTEQGLLSDEVKPILVRIRNKAEQEMVLDYIHAHPGDTPVTILSKGRYYPLKPGVNGNVECQNFLDSVLGRRE